MFVGEMRLLLAIALILLFLWLHKAQTSSADFHGTPCEAASMSEVAASFLLSPLSLYSWLASTLLRFILSVPALVLSSVYSSLLLLLALPWCVASICISVLLTCLHVALYLLHLALVVGVMAVLTQQKMADSDAPNEKEPHQRRELGEHQTKNRLRVFGRRVAQQG